MDGIRVLDTVFIPELGDLFSNFILTIDWAVQTHRYPLRDGQFQHVVEADVKGYVTDRAFGNAARPAFVRHVVYTLTERELALHPVTVVYNRLKGQYTNKTEDCSCRTIQAAVAANDAAKGIIVG